MVPMEVEAVTTPDAFVERSAFGIPRVRLVVEAEVEKRFVAVKAVDDPLTRVTLPVTLSVPPKMPLPLVVKFPTTVDDDCER